MNTQFKSISFFQFDIKELRKDLKSFRFRTKAKIVWAKGMRVYTNDGEGVELVLLYLA